MPSSPTLAADHGHPPHGPRAPIHVLLPPWRHHPAPWQLNAGLALWLAGPGNLPLWQALQGGAGPGLLLTLFTLVAATIFALLSLLTWPGVHRGTSSLLVLAAAVASHFMWTYRVVIDPTMMANVLGTDAREAGDLLSLRLVVTVATLSVPALWWLWRPPVCLAAPHRQAGRNLTGLLVGLLLAVGVALAGYQGLASLMRNQKTVRYMINPLNSVYALGRLAADRLPAQGHALEPVGEDARLGASYTGQVRPPLLVLVIGETARADRFGLNGYGRPTTPVLMDWQRERGLVNFPAVGACGTSTEVSLPCIFSPLTREQGGDDRPRHENLLDVLQRAGLAVLWLDNQSGCKGVCDRVPHASTRTLDDPRWCAGGECHDEAMLAGLDERLAALEPDRRARGVVLVLHQMGSHGPAYARRTPPDFQPFGLACRSQMLSDCSADGLRDAYDNTIAYTDRFLGRTLDWLAARQPGFDTGLLYVSDHGESLGENGLYLHGMPYALAPRQQTHVPMVMWLSAGLQRRLGASPSCLRARAMQVLSHDHVFHSVLGLLDVETTAHDPALDLLSDCRGRGSRGRTGIMAAIPALLPPS